ncbi:hypothetical protein HQ346_16895 [Rhodococcus sp. BP-252]|uniref:hypothetical protein n=1 Tax=unclassified Rhodococcus (in: high G+C Gram-positive bacteria) TaxID=192944 RepID=UPI001C9B7225|nr:MULTISPECIES: hypothetical protein [unclassified Rhodococcus (in: high G+C Gram-positive bacteria)]MBY6413374.1 hypothetical protein [Rhodococcus sp. BP-320]MBY6418022.1 hypothetical protein [Rhodococcus sp. BP-321]MBY6422288.1 hypothetical protein [Rhodococcus sp. BP-324]MBY6428071.1 hypothetical protein [Rhodococcus sp. BP-323]MBY6433295.1 hypothetical protein [Rhodococcus sp. BP-322]
MSTRLRKILIGLAVFVVVAAVGAVFFVIPNLRDDESPVDAAPTLPPTSTPEPGGSGSNGRDGFQAPVVDILGRKVTVPNNPAGQPIAQVEPGERTGCTQDGAPVSSPSGVQIQQTTAVPMLVSSSDGPTEVSGNVLTGYSRSPQGAALAGWNWISALYGPGRVAKDAYTQLTVPTAELDALTAGQSWDGPPSSAASSLPAPVAFRVVSCTDDFASIEYAIEVPVDDNGARRTTPVYSVLRAGMFYDGTNWKGRLDSRSVSGTTDITDISAFTRWALA